MRRGGSIPSRAGFAVATALVGAAVLPGIAHGADVEFTATGIEASFTSDRNVSRSSADERLSDTFFGVRVSKGFLLPVSTRSRAVFQGFAGGEKFRTYTGLSHAFIGGQGDFQYRSSAEFAAATFGAFFRTQAEYYDSELRDGYRHVFGLSVLKPVTDRMQFFGALQQNISDGKSTVFDTKSTSLRGNLDWSLGRSDTLYLGAEYRRGDIVSSGTQSLARINVADALVQDDAFSDQGYLAYRFQSNTWLATLGYNRAFAERHSVDISYRRVQSKPLHPSAYGSVSDVRYVVNQLSLAYLMRF
ncbi:MAG TPA: hypothetical protein VH867_03465 [Burkholderiales bacterium]|jgi:hypothetical protein